MTTGAESLSTHFVRILALVNRMGAVWIAVIGLYVVSGLISPGMFHFDQVLNILQVSAFLGVVATGQTLALLVGGIDVSVAGVVTMSNIVSTSVMVGRSGSMVSGVVICLLIAAFVGLINGWMITILLAPRWCIRVAHRMERSRGAPHGTVSPEFLVFGQGHLIGLPVSTICWLVIALTVVWLTQKTVFGRRLYAVGANPAAARLVGIAVRRTVTAAYILSSIMAALGGLLLTSYIGSPSLGIGDQFLLTSIAAVVVGGTALNGGVGSVLATIGGTLFITELNSFTNIVSVSTGTQFVLQGAIIALSVLLYRLIGAKRANG
jgi:ribose transport system permease protein